MLILSLIYTGLVFSAIIGVLQLAAGYRNLKGMLFFAHRVYTIIFALITIGFPLFYFFTWNSRHPIGVVEGAQQGGLFILAFVLAVVFTLTVSSAIHNKKIGNIKPQQKGLDDLQETTFFSAIRYHADNKKKQ